MNEQLPSIVESLEELISSESKFGTLYADPPWSYSNKAARGAADNHYSTMDLESICSEPVGQLAANNAHLHLWTTNAFLREAFDVMDAWGFQFKSCLIWIKPQLGMGNYWRVSHEFLCDRSHKNSYVVKFVMWRSRIARLEMLGRRTWERHIIFPSSDTIRTLFQSMHQETAEPNSRNAAWGTAAWKNYVVQPAHTVPSSEMNARSPPHNHGHHIRIPAAWRKRPPAVCRQDLPKLAAASTNPPQPKTVCGS